MFTELLCMFVRMKRVATILFFLALGFSMNARRTGAWLELPAMSRSQQNSAYTLDMTVGGVRQRNYTFLWNESRMTADWVAYPLCSGNIGTGKRSNAFGLCPLLRKRRQPVLIKGYSAGNAGWYSRGHQIPSADRLEYGANVQTFYGVNMTPQDDNLNGGVWATLENKVRNWASRCDTLYVVTGCTYDGYDGAYVLDNDGKSVAVPTGYYKALLMRDGDIFHACAFTFENRPYEDGKVTKSMAVPVSELERRTGLEFFPGLKDLVGREQYRAIKQEDPATQTFWGK